MLNKNDFVFAVIFAPEEHVPVSWLNLLCVWWNTFSASRTLLDKAIVHTKWAVLPTTIGDTVVYHPRRTDVQSSFWTSRSFSVPTKVGWQVVVENLRNSYIGIDIIISCE